MKKISLLLLLSMFATLLSAQVTYYVSATGNDTNGGTSESDALLTVAAAAAKVNENVSASSLDFNITIGEGTFSVYDLDFTSVDVNLVVNVTITGQGADATSLVPGVALSSDVTRLFKVFTTQRDEGLNISLNDLKLSDYGKIDGSGVSTIINLNKRYVYFSAQNCVFSQLMGSFCKGEHAISASFTNCSMLDCVSQAEPFFNLTRGNLTLENCVFSNCVRTYGSSDANSNGVLLHSLPTSEWVRNNITIVNNTIINCGVTDAPEASVDQRLITLSNKEEGEQNKWSDITLKFSNNIICDSRDIDCEMCAVNTCTNDVGSFVFTDCTNNVFSSLVAKEATAITYFPTEGNLIDPSLTYASSEIDFVVNQDGSLDYDTTSTGIIYLTATGSEIVGAALASAQTASDIAGGARNIPGCIGAVEYIAPGEQVIPFASYIPTPVHVDDATTIILDETVPASGLTITYTTSDASILAIGTNGYTLEPQGGAGYVTITASQAGDATWTAAQDVNKVFYFRTDTLVYYVRADGDDTQDGLSEATALATLSKAASLAVADGIYIVYSIDIDGVITNNTSTNFNFSRAENISVILSGSGAATTKYQMQDDATYDSNTLSAGKNNGRVFSTTKNTGAGDLSVLISDMTFRNFGFTNDNGGALFNLNQGGVNVDVTLQNCNIERGIARSGAIVQMTQGDYFTMKNCFVSELMTINKNAYNPPFYITNGHLSIENCIFSNIKKAERQYQNNLNAKSTGNIVDFEPNAAGCTLTLINNTFVGDSILRSEMTSTQSTINISTTKTSTLAIANNLFVGSYSASSGQDFYNVYVNAADGLITYDNCSNNVMVSDNGFGSDNEVSASLTYDSPEINFVMNGDYPMIFSTATGLNYMKCTGTSIDKKGLASVAPAFDIIGTERTSTPWIGAYDEGNNVPTHIDTEATTATLYPNPFSSILNVSENVAAISIYTLDGRVVFNSQIEGQQINLSQLPMSVYIAFCSDMNGNVVSTQRIVKQ